MIDRHGPGGSNGIDTFAQFGTAGRRIVGHDWSRSSLGPVSAWSPLLRQSVLSVLRARQPALLLWGRDHRCVLNDAASSIVGLDGENILGEPIARHWPQGWAELESPIRSALRTRREEISEPIPFLTCEHGHETESWLRFSISPLECPSNSVLLVAHDETVAQSQRRQLELVTALATGLHRSTADAVCDQAARMLAADPSLFPFAIVYQLDLQSGVARKVGCAGLPEGHMLAPDQFGPSAPVWPLLSAVESPPGKLVALTAEQSRGTGRGRWLRPVQEAFVFPLQCEAEVETATFVILGLNPVCRRDEIARTLLPVIESQLSGALGRTLENQRVSIESRFAAHDQFRKIGRELPLPMFSADASGAITWVNRAWLDLHGTQMTDEIGRTVWQRLHPDDIHTNPEELFSVLERNEPLVTELHLRDAAAREHPVLAYLIPLDDTDGQTGLLGVCFDVSVQHELRAALGESEARFRHMANHAPVMIWMTEPDGACTYLNASWYAFTGQNEQTGLGFGWLNAIPPEDRLTFQQAFATAHATGEAFRQEHRLIRADGKICWAIDSAAPRFDASGRLLGYIGSITEITRRKQMEEELREATRISETLNRVGKSLASELELETVMELVTDESLSLVGAEFGACFYHLQNAERAFTLSALKGIREGEFDEFRARHEDDLFEPTFCEGALQRRDDLHSDAEGMIHSEDLHVRSFLAVPILTREGQVRGGLFFGHSRPGQFTPMHEQIVIGIAGQAAVALENARLYGEARDADRRKDEFLAMLAHELRNPLAPIRTGLDLLQMSGTDPDIIEPMQQQLEHLIRLVDDLLDVSRIMRGRVELRITPVELASVISRAVDTVRPLMIAADQRLESSLPEESLWVSGDAVRLAQVLSNLLHNASKYSDAHSKIELTLARENDQAVITIRDYGIGIDPVLLPQVFDLFTQAPTTVDRSQGGLGIGLTITRNLIEMHGGAVEAASDGPGHGSTFRIRLPLIPGGDDTQQTSETVDLQQSLRVLVVDDNRAAARMVALLLAKLGRHQISTAYDGRTALETALRVQPHLIILDIGLPEIDGHEVARRLRRNPDFRDAVLVALTGYGTHQDRENALKAGFDDHLVKPPGIEQLRAVLMHPRLNSPEQTLDSSGASL